MQVARRFVRCATAPARLRRLSPEIAESRASLRDGVGARRRLLRRGGRAPALRRDRPGHDQLGGRAARRHRTSPRQPARRREHHAVRGGILPRSPASRRRCGGAPRGSGRAERGGRFEAVHRTDRRPGRGGRGARRVRRRRVRTARGRRRGRRGRRWRAVLPMPGAGRAGLARTGRRARTRAPRSRHRRRIRAPRPTGRARRGSRHGGGGGASLFPRSAARGNTARGRAGGAAERGAHRRAGRRVARVWSRRPHRHPPGLRSRRGHLRCVGAPPR